MSTETFNWGIIGLGKIARKFASDLKLLPNARLYAVASTSFDRAREFAEEFEAEHFFGNYQAIVKCPDIDAIYIATPHVLHFDTALYCLEHGIPVLCEKPMAMNYQQVHKMASTARRKRVFLMEALWTRFIPAFDRALQLIEEGAIGEVHTLTADFGFLGEFDPAWRLYNKSLGGGSLLDIGIYPVLLSQLLFGPPETEGIQAHATFTQTDVDESCAMIFQFPGKKMSILHSTLAANTPTEAHIHGTTGTIRLHTRWHHPYKLTITRPGKPPLEEEIDLPYEGFGYHFEAAHVMECVREGWVESDIVPLSFSENLAETLDKVREKIGLVYETDEAG